MIGQDRIVASPLAMAGVAATVADGRWRAPRLVATDRTQTGPALDPGELSTLRALMRSVVTSGTGTALASVPGEVAGKSGTAEYGGGDPPPTHAWFIAFRGDLAIAVLVENGRSGGSVAAPIAARFFQALAAVQTNATPRRRSALVEDLVEERVAPRRPQLAVIVRVDQHEDTRTGRSDRFAQAWFVRAGRPRRPRPPASRTRRRAGATSRPRARRHVDRLGAVHRRFGAGRHLGDRATTRRRAAASARGGRSAPARWPRSRRRRR